MAEAGALMTALMIEAGALMLEAGALMAPLMVGSAALMMVLMMRAEDLVRALPRALMAGAEALMVGSGQSQLLC